MVEKKLKRPFFVVNPKAYLYGKEALDLALYSDQLALKHDIDFFYTGQLVDLAIMAQHTKKLILTSQHMDYLSPGRGMGYILPEALYAAGIKATFLNHAEHPVNISALAKTIERAKEIGIITIVCADSLAETRAICQFKPDVMLCEPTELIGTGNTSDDEYMATTNQCVKTISSDSLVLQAAGISSGNDVYRAIISGADGTGGTSGIVCAPDSKLMVKEMIEALIAAKQFINNNK